jgi:dimethylaniline monooxygenase (N-oxide forming)
MRSVAIIGAGPGGLVAAKHALDAGLEPVVFEASDAVGGQWTSTPGQSGIWPGMATNTSRSMTAFADLPPDPAQPLHPQAPQIHGYLQTYAERFGLLERIRFGTRVIKVGLGWSVDGEPFDAVIIATGRFHRPNVPDQLRAFTGELIHGYDYPGADAMAGRRVLVYGNGISGSEIAADLAGRSEVTHAFRKPRYVIRKNDDGASSDWRWYTHAAALARRGLAPEALSAQTRQRILRLVGDPADHGAPRPDPDVRVAGITLTQDWLGEVESGAIVCRPSIEAVEGRAVRFADGTKGAFDALISATGYDLDVPCLGADVRAVLGPGLRLHHRTLHPDLDGFAMVGQFFALGPYFPLLELQARWAVAVLAGQLAAPDPGLMRGETSAPARPAEPHDLLSLEIAEALGVVPDLDARPELRELLLFGPLLPARYRLDGPGSHPDAAAWFAAELASSPRPDVDPEVIDALDAIQRSSR